MATTEGGFVASWLTDSGPGLVAIHVVAFDPIGVPVPVATGGGVIDVTANARADVPPAVGGIGAGPVATWVETDGNGVDHLKLQVYDAAGAPVGVPGGIDVAIAGDTNRDHFSQLSIGNPQLRDVIADGTANDADPVELDDQVAVAWVQDADPSTHNGAIMFQRWAVPTNNDRATGAPVALGLDGQFNDGNNGPVQLSVTDAGGNLHPAVGHSPVITGVESGWTIENWLEDSPTGTHLHGVILDTLTVSQLLEIAPPDTIADGSHAYLFGAGDPSDIVVGWLTPTDGGGFDLKASIYKQASDSFISETFTLKHFDTPTVPKDVSFAVAGENKLSLLVTWDGDDGTGIDATGVHGQRYSFEDGTPVGHTFDVVSGQTAADSSSLVGLLDGRFGVAYTQQDVGGDVDVHARLFDTNDSIAPVIGRDAGGAADQNPGTVFDDIIDLRDRADKGHGGLGNDVVMGGWNDDVLFGEAGNDVLVGGTGTDILIGDTGDDLLMGNHGRDYISGGDGIDTISFQGELRAVTINLAEGVVRSDAAHNAVILPAAGDIVGLPANADTDANIEDLIGLVVTDPVTEVSTFTPTHDVENAYGGLGNDALIGDDHNNILTGGGGNDSIDGGAGIDTVVLGGAVSDFTFAFDGTNFTIADHSHGTTLSATNVELFQFADGIRTAADLSEIIAGGTGNLNPVIVGGDTTAFTIAENTTAVTMVAATDPDADPVTFSIAGGSDAAAFTIDPTTGALAFVTAPDFEHPADVGHGNIYDVIVAASDGFLIDTQAIAVTVSNVAEANNPPAITSNGGNATAAISVAENTTAITTVTATDPDGDPLSYSLTGGSDQSKCQINATTGALSFIAAPNFEAPAAAGGGNVYDVIVTVSDGSSTDAQQIAVTVTDINEAPTITSNDAGATASVAVAENTSIVTTVTATDPDAGASIAYSLGGSADAALFTIDASTGALSFLSAPDFEAPADADHDNVYEVVVRASDGTLIDTQAIAVMVTDVPDGDIAPGSRRQTPPRSPRTARPCSA
jgi:Ca2+-binding RTX toxin-like protein